MITLDIKMENQLLNGILTMSSFGINIFNSFIPVTAADNLFFFSGNNEIECGRKTMLHTSGAGTN